MRGKISFLHKHWSPRKARVGRFLLLFGVGRVSKIGGELGSAVANFRRGLQEGGKEKTDETQAQ